MSAPDLVRRDFTAPAPNRLWVADFTEVVTCKVPRVSWNGRFGRLARRDVWLEQGTVWQVSARQGDGDSPMKTWTFTERAEADALVQRLLTAKPGDDWRDLTGISANAPIRHRHPQRRSQVEPPGPGAK